MRKLPIYIFTVLLFLLLFASCKPKGSYFFDDTEDYAWLPEISFPLSPDMDSVLCALVDEADPEGYTNENPIYYIFIDTYTKTKTNTRRYAQDYNIRLLWYSNEYYSNGCAYGYICKNGKTFILRDTDFPIRFSSPDRQRRFDSSPITSDDGKMTFLTWDYDYINGQLKKTCKHHLKRMNSMELEIYEDSARKAYEAISDTITSYFD